jgi:hypothetical protein
LDHWQEDHLDHGDTSHCEDVEQGLLTTIEPRLLESVKFWSPVESGSPRQVLHSELLTSSFTSPQSAISWHSLASNKSTLSHLGSYFRISLFLYFEEGRHVLSKCSEKFIYDIRLRSYIICLHFLEQGDQSDQPLNWQLISSQRTLQLKSEHSEFSLRPSSTRRWQICRSLSLRVPKAKPL